MRKGNLFIAVAAVCASTLVVSVRSGIAQHVVLAPFVQLQSATPGAQQAGNINVNGVTISGQFKGGGAGLTGVNASQLNGQAASYYLNAANLNAGTLADARLSANVPLLNGVNTFSAASNHFNNLVIAGSFQGSGGGLTGVPWSSLTGVPGTLLTLPYSGGVLDGPE